MKHPFSKLEAEIIRSRLSLPGAIADQLKEFSREEVEQGVLALDAEIQSGFVKLDKLNLAIIEDCLSSSTFFANSDDRKIWSFEMLKRYGLVADALERRFGVKVPRGLRKAA